MLGIALKLPKGKQLDQLLLQLVLLFVFIDWLNGLLKHTFGTSFALAALFKAVLLAGIVVRGWQLCPRQLRAPLSLMLLMLLGPVYVALFYSPSFSALPVLVSKLAFLAADLQLIAKAGAMLLALAYFSQLAQQNPLDFLRWLDKFVICSYGVLLFNTTLGLFGMGATAYKPMDDVAQSFLGIKGFFISTNELSGLLLVLSCWLLVRAWQVKRLAYPVIAICSLLMAALLLTKTGVFGTLILIVLIPLLLTPLSQYRQYRRRLLILLVLLLCVVVIVLYNASALLQAIGIYDKLVFAYQQRGIAGILLSSRDFYLIRNFTAVADHYPEWLQLFGVGQGGVRMLLKKFFIEIDLFDLYLFYGLAGALLYGLSFWRLFSLTTKYFHQVSAAAPVMLLNVILLLVSLMAGHVLTSGMLWLPWALLNVAIVAQYSLKQQYGLAADRLLAGSHV